MDKRSLAKQMKERNKNFSENFQKRKDEEE
jgi:hypothetical protein